MELLAQTYGDLNETRTAELQLMELTQKGSFPEYLTKFTQHTTKTAWDERAQMAQPYKGLKPNIKTAMAVQEFPKNWGNLISIAAKLDDNFRCLAQEKPGKPIFTGNYEGKKDPDVIDLSAGSARYKNGGQQQMKKQQLKKKFEEDCYNCGKKGHMAKDCRSTKRANAAEKPKEKKKQNGQPKKAQSTQIEHDHLSWTACYDHSCLTHLSEKEGSG